MRIPRTAFPRPCSNPALSERPPFAFSADAMAWRNVVLAFFQRHQFGVSSASRADSSVTVPFAKGLATRRVDDAIPDISICIGFGPHKLGFRFEFQG
jgi:hypothetical protein